MKLLLTVCLASLTCLQVFAQGEVVSYTKVDSFTIADVDTLVMNFGTPPGVIVPTYAVDVYRVIYRTPYRHIDSLVTASAALAVPVGTDTLECGVPLAAYFHGTTSKRTNTPSFGSSEMLLGVTMASTGNIVTMPDYLGLGEADPKVPVHPYIHAFSQANTGINAIRSARHMLDTLDVQTNGQLFLFGYSQGGFSTAATLKEIEEKYSSEFQVTASAPMSGAYDLKVAQVELIGSDSVYPTPGYLSYIILGYQGVYGDLYDSIQQIMKSPWDTLIPPLFYSGTRTIGYINGQVPQVPKHIIHDSVIAKFFADSNYVLRRHLAESHLLDWAPQSPVYLLYCQGDDQVTYLNSENAYDSWTANGATQVTKLDMGNFTHGDCVPFAMLNALTYFESYKQGCVTGVKEPDLLALSIYPNPTRSVVSVSGAKGGKYLVVNLLGQQLAAGKLNASGVTTIDLANLQPGTYIVTIDSGEQQLSRKVVLY